MSYPQHLPHYAIIFIWQLIMIVYFLEQMLVHLSHLCLSVLLTVISLIVFICTVTHELINDHDDDDDDDKCKNL